MLNPYGHPQRDEGHFQKGLLWWSINRIWIACMENGSSWEKKFVIEILVVAMSSLLISMVFTFRTSSCILWRASSKIEKQITKSGFFRAFCKLRVGLAQCQGIDNRNTYSTFWACKAVHMYNLDVALTTILLGKYYYPPYCNRSWEGIVHLRPPVMFSGEARFKSGK